MNLFLFTPSYALKKKHCLKRIEKRELTKYKECVQQIIQKGKTDINGKSFSSIADLTIAFYGSSKSIITCNYFLNNPTPNP